MNCLAIWYKHKPSKPKNDLDVVLHVNLWQLKKKNGKKENDIKDFLDIGIMVYEPSNVQSVNIFTPFKVKKSEISDLGNLFEKNSNLVSTIFNADLKSQLTEVQSKNLEVVDSKNKVQFYIYMIDHKNDVKMLRKNYGGSVINIKVNSQSEIKPLYYRIRISSDTLEELYTRYKPESQWLDSHSTVTELIDFRVNEKRNLDRTLLEDMGEGGWMHFKKAEYFVMREFRYDYVSSHREMLRSRRLEEDLWDSYVGDDCECDKIIAYHWSWEEKDMVPGFNAFVKYRYLTSDMTTKIKFCLFLGLIALMGGILGTVLMKIITDNLWQ